MNIFSSGPAKTEFIMKFVRAIMSQQRLVNFLMYCERNSGIVKHMPPLTWLQCVTVADGVRGCLLFVSSLCQF